MAADHEAIRRELRALFDVAARASDTEMCKAICPGFHLTAEPDETAEVCAVAASLTVAWREPYRFCSLSGAG